MCLGRSGTRCLSGRLALPRFDRVACRAGAVIFRITPVLDVSVASHLGDDTCRRDNLEQRVGLGQTVNVMVGNMGRQASLPLRSGPKRVHIALQARVSACPIV